ncbi:protoplast regeneration and killer toxin resistance protein [Trichosporon asahii var. asahii CBS 2479]|uniref:Protoplast regeneration and killer toxin resistance protein n=1 Tax=Trichosporon asahii var. asahii (strain ATCC 90039 / CBS 2479 / JCM 2466 / KCTC 7840 / NBRC 103889/ NCYC 2677 / UAMH 7654) TaxID=1186058 RepID=J5SDR7_TRIAS|nr:protoplast regeneration and killer toxin resistance protein [Trichosporon asahii var. asahii CBS 2479]EJT45156.1 protoplast regeneration and killer toxin resistance protein [Trichosporon asahii var. asahii CBS 2479]
MQAWQAPPQQPGNFNGPPPPQMQMSEEGHLGPNGFPPGGFPPGPGSTTSTRVSAAPPPLMDQSHLRPGNSASLLSHNQTIELYRENAKKTNDPELIFEFAVFMIDAAKQMVPPPNPDDPADPVNRPPAAAVDKRDELVKEATALLKRLADRGYPDAQYFLADCFANGIGTTRGKQDFDKAFPLFALAAKHGHPDACYRAGTCCEHGWGTRRESAKAIQYYKKAAVGLHPGAMYRLGTAELNGSLGLSKRPKEGVKWLKRSAEHATEEFPHALHELALLHERGIDNILFVDLDYAAELLAQASELNYAPSAFKLGECYEYGKMGCPLDPALSIHYYNIAAQQNHPQACFALTAWYLVGADGVLPQSDTEAYLWAKKAADQGLAKAQYALGYFTETGVGVEANMGQAMKWYRLASEGGDKRAARRLAGGMNGNAALNRRVEMEALKEGKAAGKGGDKDGCVVM